MQAGQELAQHFERALSGGNVIAPSDLKWPAVTPTSMTDLFDFQRRYPENMGQLWKRFLPGLSHEERQLSRPRPRAATVSGTRLGRRSLLRCVQQSSDWDRWLRERSTTTTATPAKLGHKADQPIEPAPGRSVKSRTARAEMWGTQSQEKTMSEVVIVSAARTPVGSFNGAFANTPAHELGEVAIKAALERAEVDPGEVDEVILGQVLTAGAGPEPGPPGRDRGRHPAGEDRLGPQPGLRLGPAHRRHRHAADRQRRRQRSSWPAARNRCRWRRTRPHLRAGTKMGDFKLIDTMIKDGLMDAFNGYHMGTTAENVAAELAAHPRGAGRVRRRLAEQGRGGPEGRQVQGRDRPGHGQGPQGRRRRRRRTNTSAPARRSRRWPS